VRTTTDFLSGTGHWQSSWATACVFDGEGWPSDIVLNARCPSLSAGGVAVTIMGVWSPSAAEGLYNMMSADFLPGA